jgi:hypothetical protein
MVVSATMNAVSVVIAGGYYLYAHSSGTLAPGRDSQLREVQRVLEDRFRCEVKVLIGGNDCLRLVWLGETR